MDRRDKSTRPASEVKAAKTSEKRTQRSRIEVIDLEKADVWSRRGEVRLGQREGWEDDAHTRSLRRQRSLMRAILIEPISKRSRVARKLEDPLLVVQWNHRVE